MAVCALASAPVAGQGVMYSFGSGKATPSVALADAQPTAHSVVLRADFGAASVARRARPDSRIDYAGSLRFDRVAVLTDYYLWRQLRVTGGLMVTQAVLAGGDDRVVLRIEQPEVQPYMGLGFGQPESEALGWNVYGDLGLALGRKGAVRGQSERSASAEIDAKTPQASGTDASAVKPRLGPQLKVGANLKF